MGEDRRHGRDLAENVRDRQGEPHAERRREKPCARAEDRQQPDAGDETHALTEHRQEDGRARMPDGLEIGRGDHVEQGEEVGMIKFGSRVDVFLPKDVSVAVRKGDKVVSKKTVLAYF